MRLALPTIAVILAIGGCGGSDQATTTAPGETDREQVIAVLNGLLAAEASGDGQQVCDYMPDSIRRGWSKVRDATSCAETADSIFEARGFREAADNTRVAEVTVTGDVAKAQTSITVGHDSDSLSYKLVMTAGGWKIDSISGTTLSINGH